MRFLRNYGVNSLKGLSCLAVLSSCLVMCGCYPGYLKYLNPEYERKSIARTFGIDPKTGEVLNPELVEYIFKPSSPEHQADLERSQAEGRWVERRFGETVVYTKQFKGSAAP